MMEQAEKAVGDDKTPTAQEGTQPEVDVTESLQRAADDVIKTSVGVSTRAAMAAMTFLFAGIVLLWSSGRLIISLFSSRKQGKGNVVGIWEKRKPKEKIE